MVISVWQNHNLETLITPKEMVILEELLKILSTTAEEVHQWQMLLSETPIVSNKTINTFWQQKVCTVDNMSIVAPKLH